MKRFITMSAKLLITRVFACVKGQRGERRGDMKGKGVNYTGCIVRLRSASRTCVAFTERDRIRAVLQTL